MTIDPSDPSDYADRPACPPPAEAEACHQLGCLFADLPHGQ